MTNADLLRMPTGAKPARHTLIRKEARRLLAVACEALGRPARSSAYLLGENDDQPEMSVVANLVDERDALLAALKASLAWHDSLDCRQSTTDKLKLDMAAVIRRAEGRA